MIENVSTQLTEFHCFAHCLLPGRAFASLYALLFLEKEAEIGSRVVVMIKNATRFLEPQNQKLTMSLHSSNDQDCNWISIASKRKAPYAITMPTESLRSNDIVGFWF